MMMLAIPLAWLQLTREKIRLVIALAGIGFAVILMLMQLGFRDALYESSVILHQKLRGELVLISPQSNSLAAMKTFSSQRLYQALGVEGVAAVNPIYLDFAFWKNPQTQRTRGILVLGFNPKASPFNLTEVEQNLAQVRLEDVVLFDRASREEFGPIAALFDQGQRVVTEVSGRKVRVGGLFTLGVSFAADGNIFTSDLNFVRLFSGRSLREIDIGLIRLQPGVDPEQVRQVLKATLPNDVVVFSKPEFIQFEKDYWATSTAIGFIFTLGTTMGFIVGTVIVYQILYTDVSDHLAEYATLKAMGYKSTYLFKVVLQEALILSVLGYIPGFALCLGLYQLTRNATALPLFMTFSRSLTVLLLAIIMCIVSGAIALRKVQAADPADIF